MKELRRRTYHAAEPTLPDLWVYVPGAIGNDYTGAQFNGKLSHARFVVVCKRNEVPEPNPWTGTYSWGYVRQPGESEISVLPIPAGSQTIEIEFTHSMVQGKNLQISGGVFNQGLTDIQLGWAWTNANNKITIDLTQYPQGAWLYLVLRFDDNSVIVNYLPQGFYDLASDCMGLSVVFT